jgi:hypothetical protein
VGDFLDTNLTPRARHMALWLCDLTNRHLDERNREASCDLLLRELPDFWTADEITRTAHEIRATVGPRASHRAWLTAMGWLVGEEERLPERAPQPSAHVTRNRVLPLLAKLARQLDARP